MRKSIFVIGLLSLACNPDQSTTPEPEAPEVIPAYHPAQVYLAVTFFCEGKQVPCGLVQPRPSLLVTDDQLGKRYADLQYCQDYPNDYGSAGFVYRTYDYWHTVGVEKNHQDIGAPYHNVTITNPYDTIYERFLSVEYCPVF